MLRRFQRLVIAVLRAVAQGWRLSALAPTPAARVRVIAAVTWLALPLALRPRLLALRLAKHGRPVRLLVGDAADLAAVEEVFIRDEYEVPGLDDVEVIVDLGSHIGTSIAYFHARYPEARIHGIEPDPATFAKLEANVAGLPGVTVQRRAVAAAPGETVLYASTYSMRSSLSEGWAESRAVAVPAVTLDALVAELALDRIDLLKVDIEGAEYDALAGSTALGRVRAVAGELHPLLTDPEPVLALLGDFDVALFKDSEISWRFHGIRSRG
jgi:FkbM family methyltransferase